MSATKLSASATETINEALERLFSTAPPDLVQDLCVIRDTLAGDAEPTEAPAAEPKPAAKPKKKAAKKAKKG